MFRVDETAWEELRRANNNYYIDIKVFNKKWQSCTTQKSRLGCTKIPISNRNPSKHPSIGFWKSAAEAATCKYDTGPKVAKP